jgi:hypothetical protein
MANLETRDAFDDRDRLDDNTIANRIDVIARAKRKTSTVSTLMILAGLFALVFSIGGLWMNLGSSVDVKEWIFTKMVEMANDPKTKADFQAKLDEHKNRPQETRNLEKMTSAATGGVGLLGTLLFITAGFLMKSLKAYVFCFIGSIFGLICTGCCGVTLPLAIWAIVVLNNREVKAGFDAVRAGG